jgi:hypothetical protein
LHDARVTDPDDRPRGVGRAVAELTLLLPHQQLEALESAAARHEMTVGQLLRRLIRDGLAGMDDAPGPEAPRSRTPNPTGATQVVCGFDVVVAESKDCGPVCPPAPPALSSPHPREPM